ncbi:hypothetical protein B0H67DRAFT_590495 [Lasiosphaeris hirsuta]|uniref:F-box domain-containing protein n=1 Tax=Lasiosphaeris hirsuta TaxID=260670 RepID=A0AA40DPL3_9PEZI|nr:hypothetical protein B0H67DRAFT_590495 [Lasiosphaeris hirsuta]
MIRQIPQIESGRRVVTGWEFNVPRYLSDLALSLVRHLCGVGFNHISQHGDGFGPTTTAGLGVYTFQATLFAGNACFVCVTQQPNPTLTAQLPAASDGATARPWMGSYITCLVAISGSVWAGAWGYAAPKKFKPYLPTVTCLGENSKPKYLRCTHALIEITPNQCHKVADNTTDSVCIGLRSGECPRMMGKRAAPEEWPDSPSKVTKLDDDCIDIDIDIDIGSGHSHSSNTSPTLPDYTDFDTSMLTAKLEQLTTRLEKLRLPSPFELLPSEIVLQILEHVAPEPIAIQPGTSLWDRTTEKWEVFICGRQDLINFSRTSKRMHALANDLKYRNVFISRPKSMCQLLVHLIKNPWMAPLMRHFTSAIALASLIEGNHETTLEMSAAWRHLSCLHLGGLVPDPNLAPDHPYKRLSDWFCHGPVTTLDTPRFVYVVFFTLLCFGNRLESLSFLLPAPGRHNVRCSPVWSWFLHEGSPFDGRDSCVPRDLITWLPSGEQLANGPCWPPPCLRDVTIEFGQSRDFKSYDPLAIGGDRLLGMTNSATRQLIRPAREPAANENFIHLDIVPHADAVTYAKILAQSGLSPEALAKFVKSPFSTIPHLSDPDHLTLRSCLDALAVHVPDLTDLHDHLATIGATTYCADPASRPPISPEQTRLLTRTLALLPTDWSPRLSIRAKRLALPIDDAFGYEYAISGRRRIENMLCMHNVEALTLHVPSSPRTKCDWYRRESRLDSVLAKKSPFLAHLEELHLPLRMNALETSHVYGFEGRVGLGLGRLVKLRELTVTMEGLFGGLKEWPRMFGSSVGFYPMVPANGDDWASYSALFGKEDGLEELVASLPPTLETLTLIDWYGEYADAKNMLPRAVKGLAVDRAGEDKLTWVKKLSDMQEAVADGLFNLAPFVAKMPRLKKIVYLVHKWDDAEADALWPAWCVRTHKPTSKATELKRLKKRYSTFGIRLSVKIKGSSS